MALHINTSVPPIPEAIEAMAEGLVLLNVFLLKFADERGVELPPMYETGIRYRREMRGKEFWKNAVDVRGLTQAREGDCEDLAALRAAELRYFEDDHARVKIVRTRSGFHAIVEHEDGSLEDPSKIALAIERREKAR